MAADGRSHIAEEILARSRSAEEASELYVDKVVRRPLLLKPTDEERESTKDVNGIDARARRRIAREKRISAIRKRKNLKPRPLSAKQKRKLCVFEIPNEERKFELYIPLHNLWLGYIREILGVPSPNAEEDQKRTAFVTAKNAGPMIASADMHGAFVTVVRSKSVSRVGISGIVLKDTKFTFEIITKRNVLRTIPKGDTIFRVEVPVEFEPLYLGTEDHCESMSSPSTGGTLPRNLVFELHGSSFENRPADRATKKIRIHIPPDL